MNVTTTPSLNEALAGLLEKYAVSPSQSWWLGNRGEAGQQLPDSSVMLLPGYACAEAPLSENTIPLLPWRSERRFQELKNLVDNQTITPVLMCRFACITDGEVLSLDAALYREFDLVQWLGGAPIVSVYASQCGEQAVNAIVRLESGAIGSVEVATSLPAGTPIRDRHEIIARRGVASDRVVDTQVPQSSVYVWNDSGGSEFTDTDAELSGLDSSSVSLVRSAYEALARPESRPELRQRHENLRTLVDLVHESNRQCRRLDVDGRSA